MFALYQRIADQPVPIKAFPVHIDGSDLVVAVGRVVVNALVGVAAAGVQGDLVLAAVQLTAAALLLDSMQDVEELPDALGLAAAGFRVHPHKGRTHKAGLAGQIARQAQCAEAAAVDGQVKAVRKRNRRRARRECAVVVQCEKLLRERRIVRQYTDGVIVDVQAVGVDSTTMLPVLSAMSQCSCARGSCSLNGILTMLVFASSVRTSASAAQLPSSQGISSNWATLLLPSCAGW